MMTSGTATLRLAVDHPAAAGHFPGNPIIPGAVLLREVITAIIAATNASIDGAANRGEIRSAKFHQPVRPGAALVISWAEASAGEFRYSCTIAGFDRPAVTGVLCLPTR
jgi:3-hydroxymyristoyl/3-hydroxydecanoyl-(acyl carrier protein) dehydratase